MDLFHGCCWVETNINIANYILQYRIHNLYVCSWTWFNKNYMCSFNWCGVTWLSIWRTANVVFRMKFSEISNIKGELLSTIQILKAFIFDKKVSYDFLLFFSIFKSRYVNKNMQTIHTDIVFYLQSSIISSMYAKHVFSCWTQPWKSKLNLLIVQKDKTHTLLINFLPKTPLGYNAESRVYKRCLDKDSIALKMDRWNTIVDILVELSFNHLTTFCLVNGSTK